MKNTNCYPLLVSNSFDVLMKLELVTCTLGFREISFSSLYPLPSWPFPSLFPLSCPDSSFSAVLLTLTHNGVTAVVLRPQPLSARVILQGVRGVSLPSPILPHPVIMSLYRASLLDIPQYLTLSFWSHWIVKAIVLQYYVSCPLWIVHERRNSSGVPSVSAFLSGIQTAS